MCRQEQDKIDALLGENRRLRLEQARALAIRDALKEDNLIEDMVTLCSD